jgi:hypothetical protein
VIGNTSCSFPFTYMNVTYTSCAVISGQSLCVVSSSGSNGQFPVSLVGCGGLNKYVNCNLYLINT